MVGKTGNGGNIYKRKIKERRDLKQGRAGQAVEGESESTSSFA